MSFHQIMYKVIIIGESSVGKSSILNRYTKDTFSDLTVSTITEVFTEKNVEVKGNQMKLQKVCIFAPDKLCYRKCRQ